MRKRRSDRGSLSVPSRQEGDRQDAKEKEEAIKKYAEEIAWQMTVFLGDVQFVMVKGGHFNRWLMMKANHVLLVMDRG